MKTIHKFTMTSTEQAFQIPGAAKILSAQNQQGRICIWVLLDEGDEKVERIFKAFGTGQEIDGVLEKDFIGTIQVGEFVVHLFEKTI